jgi:hypothetical protein
LRIKLNKIQISAANALDEKISRLMQLATFFSKGAADKGQITGPMEEMGITPICFCFCRCNKKIGSKVKLT